LERSISVIVATYCKENLDYLKLTLESLKRQEKVKPEVILVSSGDFQPDVGNLCYLHFHSDTRLHYAEAINRGIEMSKGDYIVISNDDLVYTKYALYTMAASIQGGHAILNPLSNCDNMWAFVTPFTFEHEGKTIEMDKRFYRWDEWAPYHESMMNAVSPFKYMLIDRTLQGNCFYCTMMPRITWELVGKLDEKLRTGLEDKDYSRRAMLKGVKSYIAAHSLVWHFGGVSAEKAMDNLTKMENQAYYDLKWNY